MRMTPSMPKIRAAGSRNPAQRARRLCPPTETLAMSQMISPAGAATAAALPRTNRVRSRTERTRTFPTWGRR